MKGFLSMRGSRVEAKLSHRPVISKSYFSMLSKRVTFPQTLKSNVSLQILGLRSASGLLLATRTPLAKMGKARAEIGQGGKFGK